MSVCIQWQWLKEMDINEKTRSFSCSCMSKLTATSLQVLMGIKVYTANAKNVVL